jgi:hypothetical protein
LSVGYEVDAGQGCRVSVIPVTSAVTSAGALADADLSHTCAHTTSTAPAYTPLPYSLHHTHSRPKHDEISAALLSAHASATRAPPTPAAANMSTPRSPRRSTESLDFLLPTPPQAQYPFPVQSDWENRPSSTGGRYQPRRGSTASSIHSVGGVLDSGFKNSMGAVREQNQNGGRTYLSPRARWGRSG